MEAITDIDDDVQLFLTQTWVHTKSRAILSSDQFAFNMHIQSKLL